MIKYDLKEEYGFKEIWNSKWKFEIPALLQGGTICLASLVKKIQNDRNRTEGGVAFQRNLEFLEFPEFQVENWNSDFVTGWQYMPSLSSKKFRTIELKLKEE